MPLKPSTMTLCGQVSFFQPLSNKATSVNIPPCHTRVSPKKNQLRKAKVGYQRHNGRWEARYRPQSRWELPRNRRTIDAFKGFVKGVYKYEFLNYFDTVEEKDRWLGEMKAQFGIWRREGQILCEGSNDKQPPTKTTKATKSFQAASRKPSIKRTESTVSETKAMATKLKYQSFRSGPSGITSSYSSNCQLKSQRVSNMFQSSCKDNMTIPNTKVQVMLQLVGRHKKESAIDLPANGFSVRIDKSHASTFHEMEFQSENDKDCLSEALTYFVIDSMCSEANDESNYRLHLDTELKNTEHFANSDEAQHHCFIESLIPNDEDFNHITWDSAVTSVYI